MSLSCGGHRTRYIPCITKVNSNSKCCLVLTCNLRILWHSLALFLSIPLNWYNLKMSQTRSGQSLEADLLPQFLPLPPSDLLLPPNLTRPTIWPSDRKPNMWSSLRWRLDEDEQSLQKFPSWEMFGILCGRLFGPSWSTNQLITPVLTRRTEVQIKVCMSC